MVISSVNDWLTCVPSDTADLFPFTSSSRLTHEIYIGTGGDLALVGQNGTATIWPGVPSGAVLKVAARRVNASGTTASGLVACYVV